jgi:hypothetical protein
VISLMRILTSNITRHSLSTTLWRCCGGGFSATGRSPVSQTKLAVDIQIELEAERSNQAALGSDHGGDAEGGGCGVRAGTIASLALLTDVGRATGVGMLNAGCLTLLVGDAAGGIRSTGVLAE